MIPSLTGIPTKPGVYIFKGAKEKVLYVGKAKNLKNRLRSYFQESANLDHRKLAMVRMIKDFSYIVTDNELEALILEANLIKQYRPKFNIILRDDKNYPYLKVTIKEEWPRLEVVRKIERDGSLYFGPYVPSGAMWEAVDFIRRNFLIRTCGYSLNKPMRPCILYQMKKCSAPCFGSINREDYMKIVEDVILFLKGEKKELIEKLQHRMQMLSEDMRFEDAAKIRDRILRLQKAFESQKIVAPELGDMDVIGYYIEKKHPDTDEQEEDIAINVLFIRNGLLIGARDFFIEKNASFSEPEMLHDFMELFYAKEIIPPDTIAANAMPEDSDALLKWLGNKKGKELRIEVPGNGKGLELLRMSNENARLHFNARQKSPIEDTLISLKRNLNLTNIPASIGAFDVSTIQGSESAGAFIFWEKGEFKKNMYRHLKIKAVEGIDDYAMMREIVGRVLLKADSTRAKEQKNLEGKLAPELRASEQSLIPLPDLIVIDGGKGQLEVARRVMEEIGIDTDLISVAKKPDRAFLLSGEVIDLEDRSRPSLLLKRIRDEVHRFAISFHRRLRDKRLTESPLENIHGIGKKRRLELLRHFGSIDNIRKASVDEITKIRGFNKKIAEEVIKNLTGEKETT